MFHNTRPKGMPAGGPTRIGVGINKPIIKIVNQERP